jgi:hypothetical protein
MQPAETPPPISRTPVVPTRGLVTWESEGTEGGPYHSRKLHVPTNGSGLTIGRGYDMKGKSSGTIINDLTKAGVSKEDAEKLAKAAGLTGEAARKFITDNSLADFEISLAAQKILFDTTYDAEAAEARRVATKSDVTAVYGNTDWDALDPAIRDMLVDLKYRGDYTPAARKLIQKAVVANDLESFSKLLGDRENWKNVPEDRFKRRKAAMDAAVEEKKRRDATMKALFGLSGPPPISSELPGRPSLVSDKFRSF